MFFTLVVAGSITGNSDAVTITGWVFDLRMGDGDPEPYIYVGKDKSNAVIEVKT